jgi:putative nucleotidyltransferase with HDIG domain
MTAPDDALFIAPDQLCIGLYVHLDLPWMDHPFSFSSFKIKSEDQIKTLRSLKLKRIRYDPERSDAPPYPHQPVAQEAAPPVEAPPPQPVDDPVLAAKRQRVEMLQQHRQECSQVEKAYLKAAGVMRNINKNLLSNPKETLAEVNELVAQMVTAFLDKADVTLQVLGEKAGGEDIYYHALNVSVLSLILAKGLGLNTDQSQMLATGALLHDIGLTEIPSKILMKTDALSQAEANLRKMHCEYGVNLGKKLGLPEPVLQVIAQHHELLDGSGYPKGLQGEALHPLARIVALVNHYDNLCNPLDIQKALTPHEALSQMFAQHRSRFDPKALQLMIRSLGVYPPGTIVRLNNEALALVSSVNTQKPLRPWVVIYDPETPSSEAVMVNLEDEPDINISKALRPSQLPTEVVEYLSPRKRVTYYFDSSSDKPAKP